MRHAFGVIIPIFPESHTIGMQHCLEPTSKSVVGYQLMVSVSIYLSWLPDSEPPKNGILSPLRAMPKSLLGTIVRLIGPFADKNPNKNGFDGGIRG